MRDEDLGPLRQPYANAAVPPGRRLADALTVGLPTLHELRDAIASDLDPAHFGIGWWAPHPGTSRRILISDHLVQCVGTVSRNLMILVNQGDATLPDFTSVAAITQLHENQ